MDANVLFAISAIVTPITVMVATIVVASQQAKTNANVNVGNLVTNQVHDAVHTSDGKTIGQLVESTDKKATVIVEATNGGT